MTIKHSNISQAHPNNNQDSEVLRQENEKLVQKLKFYEDMVSNVQGFERS